MLQIIAMSFLDQPQHDCIRSSWASTSTDITLSSFDDISSSKKAINENTKQTRPSQQIPLLAFFYCALARAVAAAVTFGLIRSAVDQVTASTLGQPLRTLPVVPSESAIQSIVWIFAALLSGLVLGLTHTLFGNTSAGFVAQYLGSAAYEPCDVAPTWLQDVLSFDVVNILSFSAVGAALSAMFFTSVVPGIARNTLMATMGGFISTLVTAALKSKQSGRYFAVYIPPSPSGSRESWAAIFCSELQGLLQTSDDIAWIRQVPSKAVAGVAAMGSLVTLEAATSSVLQEARIVGRGGSAIIAFARAFGLNFAWAFYMRLFLYLTGNSRDGEETVNESGRSRFSMSGRKDEVHKERNDVV